MSKESFWSFAAGIVIVGGFLFIGYFSITQIVKNISLLNPNIVATIIAGLVTVFGYFVTRNFERKKIIEQQIREKKLPVYEEFIGFLLKVIMGTKMNNPVSEKEMMDFILEFNKKSIVWFSDNSLLAYVNWRKKIIDSNNNYLDSLYTLEQMILAFRRDIGHHNTNINKGDLLSLFINDLETVKVDEAS